MVICAPSLTGDCLKCLTDFNEYIGTLEYDGSSIELNAEV
jgi:hypothetical protein